MNYFRRYCEMNIGGRVLVYPPMKMEFEITFSDRGSSQAKAKLYNPAPDTVSACQKRGSSFAKITIAAGYEADYGTCMTGDIIKHEVKPGSDRVLEMTVSDKSSLWASTIINKSWSGIISARDVATQIFKQVGIVPADMKFKTEKVYERGIAFSGVPFRTCMERIARDTGSRFLFKNGQAYFLHNAAGTGTAIVLGYSSGLLEAVKTGSGYKIKSLFLYKISGGSLVQLVTNDTMVNLRAGKGKHVFSTDGNAHSEFEAKAL